LVLVQSAVAVEAGRLQLKLADLAVVVAAHNNKLARREPQAKETLAVPRQATEQPVAVEQVKQARLPPQGRAPKVEMDFQAQ
jgi:hypothetical protein